MKSTLIRLTPPFLKPFLKSIYEFPSKTYNNIQLHTLAKTEMVPPKSMIKIGKGDFLKIGAEFLEFFKTHTRIAPDSKILDVGCGIGRMAIPFTQYLSPQGEFWGFDIIPFQIKWCQTRITPQYANFHFYHSNVYNRHYNLKGNILAKEYVFENQDNYFDLVYLTSVFTHMLDQEIDQYLKEIHRVLKPNGQAFITMFLLNEFSRKAIENDKSLLLDFKYPFGDCLVVSKDNPEAAIAFPEERVLEIFAQNGFKIEGPLLYGNWSNRPKHLTYQDVIIATKIS